MGPMGSDVNSWNLRPVKEEDSLPPSGWLASALLGTSAILQVRGHVKPGDAGDLPRRAIGTVTTCPVSHSLCARP